MASYLGNHAGNTNSVTEEYAVADGVTVTEGDFVYLTSGRVTNASITGKALLGTVVGGDSRDLDRDYSQTTTGNSDGDGKVLVRIEREARYLVENDNVGTTFGATHVGQKFDLTGATGAQKVDTSTVGADNGQLVCVGLGEGIQHGDATYGVFRVAAHQLDNDNDTTA